MSQLRIRHETRYTFETATAFGPWRLMMRPVDTHALRVVEASLELSPPGETRWALDVYGNSVCHYQPGGVASELRVVNHLVVDRFPAPLPLNDPQSLTPIMYAEKDRVVLEPFMNATFEADEQALPQWIGAHAPYIDEPALVYLRRLTTAIAREFDYAERETGGARSPEDTVQRRSGACRDLAVLMIETLRRFGYAARFASGYIYSPGGSARGGGSTHAWCDVFLPELGWLEFDPTNAIAESRDLIRVAAARTPDEAAPMTGSTLTPVRAQLSVSVEVSLAQEP
ncbi:MAG: transglutaminase family protein [Pseudomonadota bacterium]